MDQPIRFTWGGCSAEVRFGWHLPLQAVMVTGLESGTSLHLLLDLEYL